jgi:hypothetical protein
MTKILGLGELLEGVLERDPLDDTYQIHCADDDTEEGKVVRLEDILPEYVGHAVRFTIAFAGALEAHAERINADEAQEVHAVTFEDLSKGGSSHG